MPVYRDVLGNPTERPDDVPVRWLQRWVSLYSCGAIAILVSSCRHALEDESSDS